MRNVRTRNFAVYITIVTLFTLQVQIIQLVLKSWPSNLSLVFLLISNLTNGLRLHHFLGTENTEVNKSLKTDANGAH